MNKKGNKNIKSLKQILFSIIFVFSIIISAQTTKAVYLENWEILKFDTDIEVLLNGEIIVVENIVADFTNEEHHGIIRSIPIKYRDKFNHNLSLKLKVISVTDENNKKWDYQTYYENGYINIKIGSPYVMLDDTNTFSIKYSVDRAMMFSFEDHDELYWNATGNEWVVPIKQSSATISFPSEIPESQVDYLCFTGKLGSESQKCRSTVKNNRIFFMAEEDFKPFEGLTIVASFPKGIIQKPSDIKMLFWGIGDNWGYALPVITLIIFGFLWSKKIKETKTNKDTIMPIYSPPDNLSPSEIGTLIDESADPKDVSASIIDLAVRGYIKIEETKEKAIFGTVKKYKFYLLKDITEKTELKNYEQKILKTMFKSDKSTTLDIIKIRMENRLQEINDDIYEELVKKEFFLTNPNTVRTTYAGIGITLFVIFLSFIGFFIDYNLSIGIGLCASSLIMAVLSFFIPKKTKKGVEMYYKVLGLKMFIKTAEKDRLQWKEKENIFEKLLPYAMVFNLADKWSNTFKDIYTTPPKWYSSTDTTFINSFNSYTFIKELNNISSSINSSLRTTASSSGSSGFSSGGGFSGGGFGGGGGRGW